MPGRPPLLQVVVATRHPGRAGTAVADWFVDHARSHGLVEVEVLDLSELDLPERDDPRVPPDTDPSRAWREAMSRGHACVFVMPEYNFGFHPELEHALALLDRVGAPTPAGVVGYGGQTGGARAGHLLRHALTTAGMRVVDPMVTIPFVSRYVADDVFHPTAQVHGAADALLSGLELGALAAAPLRVTA